LPVESTLLTRLVHEGWGKSWGLYLTSDRQFDDVRKHFRHFLIVSTEDRRELYFRFYDPRVLRTFLPTCTPDETDVFFGSVSRFLLEGEDSESLLVFTNSGSSAVVERLLVAAREENLSGVTT
jgi:hypothetical protein